jgi:hypothetical protein
MAPTCRRRQQGVPWALGAAGKKTQKTANVRTYFIWPGLTFLHARYRDFFYRVFEFPLSKNAQKRTKTKLVRGKKIDARRTTPRALFITFLSSPHREALNQRNKKIERKRS